MTVTAETLQWHLCLQFGLSLSLPQAAFVTLVILPARNLGALSTNLRHRTSNFITLVKYSMEIGLDLRAEPMKSKGCRVG